MSGEQRGSDIGKALVALPPGVGAVIDATMNERAKAQASAASEILGRKKVTLRVSSLDFMMVFHLSDANIVHLAERAQTRFNQARPDMKGKPMDTVTATRYTFEDAMRTISEATRQVRDSASIPFHVVSGCCSADNCPLLDFNSCVVEEINDMFGL